MIFELIAKRFKLNMYNCECGNPKCLLDFHNGRTVVFYYKDGTIRFPSDKKIRNVSISDPDLFKIIEQQI